MTNETLIEQSENLLSREDELNNQINTIRDERADLYYSFIEERIGKFFRIEEKENHLVILLRVNKIYNDGHCFCTLFETKDGIDKSITLKTDTLMNITVIRLIVNETTKELDEAEVLKLGKKFNALKKIF